MKLSAPTNWDPALIEGLARFAEVEDVFGKLAVDLVGGGRPAYVVPKVDRDGAARHIADCHAAGIRFTYLLNTTCCYGHEFDRAWREAFHALLDDLVEMGVDKVTVALPYLIEVVQARHPGLVVNVSSFAQVNSVERARRFDRLGAGEITLDFLDAQRDFPLMEAMARAVDARLQVLANHTCLYQCPSRGHHANLSSHGSQRARRDEGGAILDYCVLGCLETKLADPVELIRSQWIRPEDVHLYEELGIQKIKLVDRARSTDWILSVVEAYARRETPNGDLIGILNAAGSGTLPFADFAEFLAADAARPELARTFGALAARPFVRIDSAALDGFLEQVRAIDCRTTDCDVCGVCADFAARAVRPNPELTADQANALPAIRAALGGYLASIHGGAVYE